MEKTSPSLRPIVGTTVESKEREKVIRSKLMTDRETQNVRVIGVLRRSGERGLYFVDAVQKLETQFQERTRILLKHANLLNLTNISSAEYKT